MEIIYDKPIEVTQAQLYELRKNLGGIFAWRKTKEGKFLIKVWMMKYAYLVNQILNP